VLAGARHLQHDLAHRGQQPPAVAAAAVTAALRHPALVPARLDLVGDGVVHHLLQQLAGRGLQRHRQIPAKQALDLTELLVVVWFGGKVQLSHRVCSPLG